MLLPAIAVLTDDLPVRSAGALIAPYADQARVAVRSRRGPVTVWYLLTVRQVRQQIQGAPEHATIREVLGLDQAVPAPTAQLSATPAPGAQPILLLDGEQVAGVIEPDMSAAEPPKAEKAAEEGWAGRSEMGFQRSARRTGRAQAEIVRIFFGTDRAPMPDPACAPYYGIARGELVFGCADVSFPARHAEGKIERPSWWRLEFRENPARHVVVAAIESLPRNRFVEDIRSVLSRTSRKHALLFVHGYNVPFPDAVRRTAQLAYDLRDDEDRELPGVPLLYSWPSQGEVLKYLTDETNISWTKSHFQQFLQLAVAETGAEVVHVIAHSMGTRALIEVLAEFQAAPGSARLDQVILAAPDFDADTLAMLAAKLSTRAGRCTLYASSGDHALQASRELRSDLARAGESGERIFVAKGIDTIDASNVDTSLLGHSYFGERTVLGDIFSLLKDGKGPDDRGLKSHEKLNVRYWELVP